MTALDTVTARNKLKTRESIYWHKLDRGCHLGLRKMSATSEGIWWARYYNADSRERPKKKLGEFTDLPGAERFSIAKKEAEAWFLHLGRGGSAHPVKVGAACLTYVDHVRTERGDTAADDLAGRYSRWVLDSPIAKVELSKLTPLKLMDWRANLIRTEAKISRDSRERPLTRPRCAGTVNRDMTALRAALNHAHRLGHVTSANSCAAIRDERRHDRASLRPHAQEPRCRCARNARDMTPHAESALQNSFSCASDRRMSTTRARKQAFVAESVAAMSVQHIALMLQNKSATIATLEHQFAWFKRQLFGKMSERFAKDAQPRWVDPKQGNAPAVPHGFKSAFKDWCTETTSFANELSEGALDLAPGITGHGLCAG